MEIKPSYGMNNNVNNSLNNNQNNIFNSNSNSQEKVYGYGMNISNNGMMKSNNVTNVPNPILKAYGFENGNPNNMDLNKPIEDKKEVIIKKVKIFTIVSIIVFIVILFTIYCIKIK